MSPPVPHIWLHHLADEADAAFLYRELARAEPDRLKADIYAQLAEVEDRHVAVWRRLLAEHGHEVGQPSPSRRARFTAWLGRMLLPQSWGGLTKGCAVFAGAVVLSWLTTMVLRRMPLMGRIL